MDLGIAMVGYAIFDEDKDEPYVYCPDMDDLELYCSMRGETPEEFATQLGYVPEDFLRVWFFESEGRVYFMLSEGIDKSSVVSIDDFVLCGV